jgi:hypothetical protein
MSEPTDKDRPVGDQPPKRKKCVCEECKLKKQCRDKKKKPPQEKP